VTHPGAVVVLPILDDGRIVFIRQFRHALDEILWELPAGTLEPDEPPMETARRELIEETGYRSDSMEPLVEFFTSPGILTERMSAFVARGLRWVGARPDHGESIAVEPLPIQTAYDRYLSGDFRDAKTIAVLGMFFLRNQVGRGS